MIHTSYIKELHRSIGYLPIWLPTARVRVGDIGKLTAGGFQGVSSLTTQGIAFDAETDGGIGDIQYASSGSVQISTSNESRVPGALGLAGGVESSIKVEFKNGRSIVFHAASCATTRIVELSNLEAALLKRVKKKQWDCDLVVISEVMNAGSATILIASGESAAIELRGQVAQSAIGVNLASVAGAGSIIASKNIGVTIVGQKKLTPLFKAVYVSDSLFKSPSLQIRGSRDRSVNANDDPPCLRELTKEKYLSSFQ